MVGKPYLTDYVRQYSDDGQTFRDVKALCVITPAAIGPQYFRECAEVLAAASGGPPDKAKMIDIMRRHGLTPAIAEPAR
jgi:hypothetical protein